MEALFSTNASDPILLELIDDYIFHTIREIDDLQHAIEEDDLKRLLQLSHKIAGSAAIYGFESLARSIEVLENSARKFAPKEELILLLSRVKHISSRIALGRQMSRS